MRRNPKPARMEPMKVSVLLPVCNGEMFLPECLDSILAQDFADLEILIADDASSDGSAALVDHYSQRDSRIRWWKNPINLGLARNFNRCLHEASGEYIKFVLQDDKLVSESAIRCMAEFLDRHPQVSLVSSATQILDEYSRVIELRDGFPSGIFQGQRVILRCLEEQGNPVGEPSVVMFRRRQAQRGFDEQLQQLPDVDLWFHLLKQGDFAYLAEPLCAFRRHAAQQTKVNSRSGVNDQLTLITKWYAEPWLRTRITRRALFSQIRGLRKQTTPEARSLAAQMMRQLGWGRYCFLSCRRKIFRPFQNLHRHFSRRNRIESARRERPAEKRVLVVDERPLTRQQDSGSLRMFNLLRLLVRMGIQTTFVADNLQRNPDTEELESLGVECLSRQHIKNLARFLSRHSAKFDYVILSRLVVAEKYVDLIKRRAPNTKVIFDTVDLHYLRIGREALVKNDEALQGFAAGCKERELALARKAHLTLVVSPAEKQVLELECPGLRVGIVSNIHERRNRGMDFSDRRDLLFIGGFLHAPNIDAVTYFTRDIFPRVEKRLPGVRFHILGSHVPDEILQLASPGICVHGFVEDVGPMFNACKLSVAPLRFGAGIKGKINQSQSYGVPVVATSVAVEGMQLENGHSVLVADTPDAFALAVADAYTDEKLWNRLAENGLKNLQEHFSFEAAQATLTGILDLHPGSTPESAPSPNRGSADGNKKIMRAPPSTTPIKIHIAPGR